MNSGSTSTSSAFQDGCVLPALIAPIHTLLASRGVNGDILSQVQFRVGVNRKQLSEIRQLHAEWFPVEYTDEFFESLLDSHRSGVCTIVASVDACIVGLVTVATKRLEKQYNFSCDLLPSLDLRPHSDRVAYILTLGVVDELRKIGLARILLERAIGVCKSVDSKCKVVFLHVIEYNAAAIRLYEKQGFRAFKTDPAFYRIQDAWYDGILFYKIVGVDRGRSWGETISAFLSAAASLIFHPFRRQKERQLTTNNELITSDLETV